MTIFLIYLFLTLPNLINFFGALAALSAVGFFMTLFYNGVILEKLVTKKLLIFLITIGIFFGFLQTIIPTKEVTYVLAGAYVTQLAIESDTGKQAIQLLNSKIAKLISGEVKSK